jgi:ATPase subunit of ABC transporter with duplicated ATPase domains
MTAVPPAITCARLSFSWPDAPPGTPLHRLDATFPPGRTGLVGDNGTGKSTLLRLIAGELTPASGTITTTGEVAYLPQALPLTGGRTVAELLGVAAHRAALAAVEAGDPTGLDVLEGDWGAEEQSLATLGRLGLPDEPAFLDRTVATLSGGEAMLVGIAGLLRRPAAVTLLDEPTNNLDRDHREHLYAAVAEWPGVLVVVSHDRDLLEQVEQIAELRDGALRLYGGPFSHYLAQVAEEQEAAERRVRAAEANVRRERRDLLDAQTDLARRERAGRKAEREKRVPRIVAHGRKRAAQVSAGKYRELHESRLAAARDELTAAEAAVREDDRIRIDLPATAVPAGRTVLRHEPPDGPALVVRGPERIALLGRNGAGKTTLLRRILAGGTASVPVGYLPQRLDVLDERRTVLENVRRFASSATPHEVRAQLARFLVRGAAVDRPAGTLSGGERFRVTLACLLLADPAPQLVLLDEPTNNLDLSSVAQLGSALQHYRGALIVASHDRAFLGAIGVQRCWQLADGAVRDGPYEP